MMFGRKQRKYEAVMAAAPLLVTEFGRYADTCLNLAFAMSRGQILTPQLTTWDMQQIDTFRLWFECATEVARKDLTQFVQMYQVHSTRFKAWIISYNDAQQSVFLEMSQEERDFALLQMSGGAVRATLELRSAVECLWGQVGQEAVSGRPELQGWLRAKFLYSGEKPEDWPQTLRLLGQMVAL